MNVLANRECNFDCFIYFFELHGITILSHPIPIYDVLAFVHALHAGHTTVWEPFAALLPQVTVCDY